MAHKQTNSWRKAFDDLTFTDDYLFKRIMQNGEICKRVLQVLLGKRITRIVSLETEKEVTLEFFAHGVRFDVYVEGSDEAVDIEMQTYREADLAARMRRNHAQLDLLTMDKDNPAGAAKATCVIFICTFDPFRRGLPVYSFSWREETHLDLTLGDKSRRIVYNAPAWESCSNEELSSFLRYVATQKACSKLSADLDEAVSFAKHSTSWRMGYNMIYEAIAQAKEEGAHECRLETARTFLTMGLPPEQVAQGTGLTLQEVEALRQSRY